MAIAQRLIAEEREKKTGFLDLGNLGLTEIPVELFELTHLHGLNLGIHYVDEQGEYHKSSNGDENSANELQTLPSTVANLVHLTTLSLMDNLISDLSPLIGCKSLERLRASGCRLNNFPRQLLFHQTLRDLILHEVTIPGIPAEVLSADDDSSCLTDLRNHLFDLEHGTEDVSEAKLIVLGNGRVGKTQICWRLRGLPYDETVSSTHGITVTADPWAGSTNGDILNIWDFGGQDLYHGAHTLFMKTSAIFLIVWHPDFEALGEQSADGILFRNYPLPY